MAWKSKWSWGDYYGLLEEKRTDFGNCGVIWDRFRLNQAKKGISSKNTENKVEKSDVVGQ